MLRFKRLCLIVCASLFCAHIFFPTEAFFFCLGCRCTRAAAARSGGGDDAEALREQVARITRKANEAARLLEAYSRQFGPLG